MFCIPVERSVILSYIALHNVFVVRTKQESAMTTAAALLANTVPLAGLFVAAEKRAEARELFIVSYVGSAGVLLSAIAYFGGFISTTPFGL